MKLIKIMLVFIGIALINLSISCLQQNNIDLNTGNDTPINQSLRHPFVLLNREQFDSIIKESDFCITGQKIMTKEENIDLHGWREEGEIKVKDIIYGNPPAEKLPYSYTYSVPGFCPWPWETIMRPNHSAPMLPPDNSKVVVIGKGSGENIQLLYVFWDYVEPSDAIPETIKEIKMIKEFECLNKDEFLKRLEKLVLESNDNVVLGYLARRSWRESQSRIKDRIDIIKTLSDKGKITPNRKFLAYGFALYTLYYNHDELSQAQINELVDMTLNNLSSEYSIDNSINYLRVLKRITVNPYIGLPKPHPSELTWKGLFDKVPALKDKLKQITNDLSQKFKDDKDYPEWEKWVNKIFPPASPMSIGGPETNGK